MTISARIAAMDQTTLRTAFPPLLHQKQPSAVPATGPSSRNGYDFKVPVDTTRGTRVDLSV